MAAAPVPRPAEKLLRLEPIWLLVISPLVLMPGKIVPAGWHWAAVAAALLFWPLRLLIRGSVAPRTPLRLPATLLLLCVPGAILIALDRTRAWEVAGYLLLSVAWANALAQWPPVQQRPARLLAALLLLAAGLSLAGPLILTGEFRQSALMALQQVVAPLTRVVGDTMNPNTLANALLVVYPFALALALRSGWAQGRWAQSRWPRVLIAFFTLWLTALLGLTLSRGAWLGLAVVVPLLLGLRWPRLLWLLPLALGAVVSVLLLRPSLAGGVVDRVEIWERGLFLLREYPITGAGLGQFAPVVARQFPLESANAILPVLDAHNVLLQVGADLGLPGLVAWLALLIAQVAMMGIVLRQKPAPLTWAMAAGALASVVGALVAGFFNSANWGVKVAILPWLVTALIVVVYDQAARGRQGGASASASVA